ncbi:MAG: glutamate 5-kinase [Prevotellaceae bacterium]|jgi:glutamate 5-kinase|nr:glutamate 5-kinase [Prevotellaceae bacterium]
MKIVIKVGTQSILATDAKPDEGILSAIIDRIIAMQREGHHVWLVSSGAVGSGRYIAKQIQNREYGSSLEEKQLLASVGQHELMTLYSSLSQKYGVLVSQLLLSKQDFNTRKNRQNVTRLLQTISAHGDIIPVINENDTIATKELMFTDNDELAGLIAMLVNADKLLLLTNVDGVYRSDMKTLIDTIDPSEGEIKVSKAASAGGRGGMASKLTTARKASDAGIMVHIMSIKNIVNLDKILAGERYGTTVLPRKSQ